MKTIEEAKDDCILDCGCLNYRESDYTAGYAGGVDYGFEAGVEFAQRWISVEDELPNAEGEANRLSKVVIAKCEDLADEVSAYYDTITKDWRIYPSGQIIKATNWRPIELK